MEAARMSDERVLAEHLMLLDLGRKDAGRVANVSTVRPIEKLAIERCGHVMHIDSNVVGELSERHDAPSALLAGLSAGTLSGAPNVRAIEIFDRLEPERRRFCGVGAGRLSADRDMDMCIARRASVLNDRQHRIQAGSGIVLDSDPDAKWIEKGNKSDTLKRGCRGCRPFRAQRKPNPHFRAAMRTSMVAVPCNALERDHRVEWESPVVIHPALDGSAQQSA